LSGKKILALISFIFLVSTVIFGQSLSLGKTIVSVTLKSSEQISDRTLDKEYQQIVKVAQLSGRKPESVSKNDVLKTLIDEILLRLAAENKNIKVQEAE
jgi:hypothetical protein